ncbi:hypothetical protein KGA65_03880 [Ideonella sp. B7]|uniref:hypothetical protein n=1 Tax=Ideonella benzenivorans TaxID=2831643 RepID=UPI001CEC981E|nr:hypothetical protein [Ideonella benzenivorans]MCA6215679.1 hypothetical protein [Ideonella benzenivorans]
MFFRNGDAEYFTLTFHPQNNSQSIIFRLNKIQIYFSNKLLPFIFYSSIFSFLANLTGALLQITNPAYAEETAIETAVLAIACIASGAAFLEVAFFFWMRKCGEKTKPEEMSSAEIRPRKSLQTYLTFLLCMTTPLLGLLALPGGMGRTWSEMHDMGPLLLFMLCQLLAAFLALAVILLRRIFLLANYQAPGD